MSNKNELLEKEEIKPSSVETAENTEENTIKIEKSSKKSKKIN